MLRICGVARCRQRGRFDAKPGRAGKHACNDNIRTGYDSTPEHAGINPIKAGIHAGTRDNPGADRRASSPGSNNTTPDANAATDPKTYSQTHAETHP